MRMIEPSIEHADTAINPSSEGGGTIKVIGLQYVGQ
jgi:hypothetical protein